MLIQCIAFFFSTSCCHISYQHLSTHFFNHLIKHFSNNTNVFLPQLMFSTLIFLWKQEKCDVPSTKSFSQWSPRICAPIYEQWNACEMGTFQWKIAYIMLKPLLQSHRKWVGRVGKDFLFELGKKPHMHLVEIGIFDRHFTSWSWEWLFPFF